MTATDQTQPRLLQVEKFGPNPTQPNRPTTNNGVYSFSSDVFLYTELIGFDSGQIARKISVSVTAKVRRSVIVIFQSKY